MRTLVRVGALVAGLLLLVAGVAGAALVGSDDSLESADTVVESSGRPVVTVPDLLAYDDAEVVVTASSEDEVMIATAHPVDVADWSAGTRHVELSAFGRDGVSTEGVGRGAAPRSADSVDFWTDDASGAGEQTLVVGTADGHPRFVVEPLGSAPVTLSMGLVVPGLFWLCWAVVALGLLLLLAGGLLWRRGRATATGPGRVTESGAADPRLVRGLAAALALVALLGSCGWVPERVDYQAPSRPALAPDQGQALLDSYDRRNNRAIRRASTPPYDGDAWETADTGPVLEGDDFSTRYDEVTRNTKASSLRHRADEVFAASFDAYPMWAMVTSTTRSAEKAQEESRTTKDDDLVSLDVFTREHVTDDWLMSHGVEVHADDLPDPVAGAPLPGRADRAGARAALGELWSYLRSGRGDLRDPGLTRLRDQWVGVARQQPRIVEGATMEVVEYADPQDRLRAVRVAGGTLAVGATDLATRVRAREGVDLSWTGTSYERLRLEAEGGDLLASWVVQTAVFVPDDGPPQPLGSTWHEVLY